MRPSSEASSELLDTPLAPRETQTPLLSPAPGPRALAPTVPIQEGWAGGR